MIVKKEKTEALADAAERAQMQGSSLWDDAWRRFRKNRAAVYSVTILALITLFVIFAPMLTHYAYDFNDWDALSAPPSARHFLGTDSLGRDLLSRAAVGGRISLLVGLSGALVAVVIGTLYGALAGFFGGKIDSLMMRFLEILNAFPFMLFVILLTTFFGRSLILIFAAVGLVSWLDVARIVRGQTLSLKHKEFVEAARVSGMSRRRIVVRHIIPNVLGVVMVYASLLVPGMIMYESFLSFLGLGVQEPMASWGSMLQEGALTIETAPWQLLVPAFFLVATLFCFNFLGDGLRDALDPKDR
ncbi:oligopeptide ABC transporter permease OppC [Lautropia dentalis]|jgi:oligopeptide transport system permease protein OppC|uniref:Oligopeptide transport system permease protein OppC n=1 Tax=Lautropia dentalis TaxID=2490857 RepID=A0A426FLA8_9BURK|nr:oligopeptide ABC transporter permease OppC [Lautropia dentalis]RRN43601.1 oligopeptide ABC transporter permease OppC [Lautropia dentalis]